MIGLSKNVNEQRRLWDSSYDWNTKHLFPMVSRNCILAQRALIYNGITKYSWKYSKSAKRKFGGPLNYPKDGETGGRRETTKDVKGTR